MSGICALCQRQADLCESHIIPEFAYKPIYDEKHRMIAFSPQMPDERRYEQKGPRCPLLCSSCEGRINTSFEDPFKRFWIDADPLKEIKDNSSLVVANTDYSRFKLFHLSVLWRASVSSHETFWQVDLGPHSDTIRHMLWDENPGPSWLYPIVCTAIIGDDGGIRRNFVTSPLHFRLDGHRGYMFTFCGCQWRYVVSSHRMPEIEGLCLNDRGELPIGTREVREVLREIHEQCARSR